MSGDGGRLLLDSSACIAFLRNKPAGTRDRFGRWPADRAALSAVVLAELEFGIALSTHPAKGREGLDLLLQLAPVEPWTEDAARIYGPMRAKLHREGRQIGPLDMLIAAHALSLSLTLLTGNIREFEQVPGLQVISLDDA